MTEQEEQELTAVKKMLESDGWRVFHREHKQRAEDLRRNSWDSVRTLEQLHYMRGCLDILEQIVKYERLIEAAETVPDGSDLI
jgi:hypothetical protein